MSSPIPDITARTINAPLVLLVEDSDLDTDLFRRSLELSGLPWRLLVLRNGEQVIDFLTRHEAKAIESVDLPDLILMDLNLPKKTGRQALGEIKAHPTFRRIPLLIYTGTENFRDVLDSCDEHANAFLRKPIYVDETVQMLKGIHEFWFSRSRFPWSGGKWDG